MTTNSTAAQRGMQANAVKLAEAQLRANSLQKNTRLSDDPGAASDSLAVRAAQAQAAQHGRNIDNGDGWLTMANGALDTSVTLLQRVQYLTLQGANGGITPEAKEAIAVELDSISGELLAQANTKFLGRTIFAGNSDAGSAFKGTPPEFTGTGNGPVLRRISGEATVRVDADGAAIFANGADSVFEQVSKIAADLRAGTDIADSIDTVNAALNNVIGQRSVLGARHAELLRAKDSNVNALVDLESQRASVEDLDLGRAILDLKTQELAYQASLSVTAKVLSTTLMDFLR
ncbi:MAG: flagellar hook-associated protein 3 [Specibacter sp.]